MGIPYTKEESELVIQLYRDGYGFDVISKKTGRGVGSIAHHLSTQGIPRDRGRRRNPKERIQRIAELAAQGMTGSEIGEAVGMTRNAVLGIMHRNKIKSQSGDNGGGKALRAKRKRVRRTWTLEMEEEVRRLVEARFSSRAIAREFGFSDSTVRWKLRQLGLKTKFERYYSRGTPGRKKPRLKSHGHIPLGAAAIAYGNPGAFGAGPAHEALERHHCRWPIGEPQDTGFHFCSDKAIDGSSYCQTHTDCGLM